MLYISLFWLSRFLVSNAGMFLFSSVIACLIVIGYMFALLLAVIDLFSYQTPNDIGIKASAIFYCHRDTTFYNAIKFVGRCFFRNLFYNEIFILMSSCNGTVMIEILVFFLYWTITSDL